MYDVGLFVGKFSPPHIGHINAILNAGTLCKKLYVVVSHHEKLESAMYENTGFAVPTLQQKIKWLSKELDELQHISVIGLDESHVPEYPDGWEEWSYLLNDVIPETFDVIFGGEPQYASEGYTKYFPDVKYELYDTERKEYPIRATEIRNNPYNSWDFIIPSAREHFVKRILLTGTESCGKSTMTKMLSLLYNTSYVQEEGRYYSRRYLGGNDAAFEPSDFISIGMEQILAEKKGIETANKLLFIDTDSIVTEFYSKMYTGEIKQELIHFRHLSDYDLILYFEPDVEWIADGYRFNDCDDTRMQLDMQLQK
ncbi:Bifunctional NAD biosynthesis protein NadR [Methanimicrococcus sp. At1]|uniref:Bifunctional NAD biosynthesis protein NadR n=1 Tax=Methanimicrococcus hacksteinii TaxID=3028293 RepID=A0ABU3VRI4_9EURY|nr:multifunctional transcriptional regulator/nicotinamide-nucleotide adenylyltransferase/ribosylnicotinamide kinase NadR [Methanimicrococcus sp. At1]MDV0445914.1 Bifunctional NAD biosynthesis protein NadR [Methanimicrococcus sp. At1]